MHEAQYCVSCSRVGMVSSWPNGPVLVGVGPIFPRFQCMVFFHGNSGGHAHRDQLRNLKPQDKLYKMIDRDGLYVAVTPVGSISFRYNYSVNGRQETIAFGRYGLGGITLAEARELLGMRGRWSPMASLRQRKKRVRRRTRRGTETFDAWAE